MSTALLAFVAICVYFWGVNKMEMKKQIKKDEVEAYHDHKHWVELQIRRHHNRNGKVFTKFIRGLHHWRKENVKH